VLEEKVCVGDKDLTWETPAQRGRVNTYVTVGIKQTKNFDCDNDLICLEQA
jgi:hypothetical protein